MSGTFKPYICQAVLLKTSQSKIILNYPRLQKVFNQQISNSLRNLSVLCVFYSYFFDWYIYLSMCRIGALMWAV